MDGQQDREDFWMPLASRLIHDDVKNDTTTTVTTTSSIAIAKEAEGVEQCQMKRISAWTVSFQ